MSCTNGRVQLRPDLEQMGILTIAVPNVELATDLVAQLEDRWACCAPDDDDDPIAIVFLSPHNVSDFSQLVRRVQAWLSEHSLGPIAFQLRGRGHIHGHTAAPAR